MKKFKKLFLVVALMLISTTFMPVISSVVNLSYAAPETNFSYLTVEGFEDEANVGSTYVIKNAKVYNNANGVISPSEESATVAVKDPIGKDVTLDENGEIYSFKVDSIGDYSIIYTYDGYSQTLSMTAKEGIYSFKFSNNTDKIIPTYVNIEKYTGKIVLPNPEILDEDGNVIDEAKLEVKVLPPSSDDYLSTEALVKNTEGFYEFTANVVGNWTVNYIYKSADGKVLASTTKTFTANNTYNNDYNLLIINNSTSKPTTAVTGVMTTLPTITGKNSVTEDKVDISYTITAKRVVYNATTGAIVSEENANSCLANVNEFTPDKDGDYIITYHAENFFGNSAEWEFEITGVKDTKDPIVRIVNPYTTSPAEDDDATYSLPEKAGLNNIVIPAIWADDNVDTTLDKLTLTRKITKSNGDVIYEKAENPNKELVFNHTEDLTLNPDTQVAVTLDEDVTFGVGTYNVAFIAKDSAGNEATATTYRLVIENGFADDEEPEVKWSESDAIPTQTRVGDTISFASPTATDNVSTRIKLVVDYQFVDVDVNEDNWTELELKDSQYTIEVEEANRLTIRVTATDAYGNSKSIKKDIDIHDTNDILPTKVLKTEEFKGNGSDIPDNVYKQQNEITLRTVKYEDDYADYVQVGVYVSVEKDGETIYLPTYDSLKNVEYSDLDTIEVSNTKVWASYSGDYKVAYVSKDLKNNYTIMFYSFNIASYTETTEIEFTKLPTTLNGGVLELGERILMPTADINAEEGYTKSYNVRLLSGPTSEKTVLNKYEFIPAKTGTYVIEYYGSVSLGETTLYPESVKFTVEVKDTTKPVLGEIYVEPVVAVGYELTIPQFTAYDLSGIDAENSKVVLSSKSYGTKTIYYGDLTTNRTVKLNYNEVYTLTFTVYDKAGNSPTTLTKEIKVGDTDSPIITINEDNKVFIEESIPYSATGKLTIDLSQITVSDLVDTTLSKDDLVITVTRDGQEIDNIHGDSKTNYEYNINKAGEYTVTIKITDAAGNVSEPVVRKFTVSASANNGVDKNEVIGTILIVVSVLILAGVIVYFIVSKKKNDKYKV